MFKMKGILFCTLYVTSLVSARLFIEPEKLGYDENLTTCVLKLGAEVNFKNFSKHMDVTIVNAKDDLDLSVFHNKQRVRFVSRQFSWNTDYIYNVAYIVMSQNYQELEQGLNKIIGDDYWNPFANFVIVIQDLETYSLKDVTYLLHEYNIMYQVTVISRNRDDYAIYRYNVPAPNNCVLSSRLTFVSMCSKYRRNLNVPTLADNFNIRNCKFKLMARNAWPFVNFDSKSKGFEQLLIGLFEKYNGFKMELERFELINRYGSITANITQQLLNKLVNNEVEGVLGGYTIKPQYVGNFTYSYPWSIDRESFVLSHADFVRQWAAISHKSMDTFYVLGFVFVLFCVFAKLFSIFPNKEKSIFYDILLVFGYLLNKNVVRNTRPGWSRSLIFSTILFTAFIMPYAINAILYSVTTQPFRGYEPKSIDELKNLQPVLFTDSTELSRFEDHLDCGSRRNCLNAIIYNQKKTFFTVITDTHFKLFQYKLTDGRCNPALYRLQEPLLKTYRTIVFRRGSILIRPFHQLVFRVKATGIFHKMYKDLFRRKYVPCIRSLKSKDVPLTLYEFYYVYVILIVGYCLSILVFIYELIFRSKRNVENSSDH